MKTQLTPAERAFVVVGALMGWFAVGLQFYLVIVNRVESLPETMIRFFSYFTILTNILVALYFTAVASGKRNWPEAFFCQAWYVNGDYDLHYRGWTGVSANSAAALESGGLV